MNPLTYVFDGDEQVGSVVDGKLVIKTRKGTNKLVKLTKKWMAKRSKFFEGNTK